VYLLFAWGGDEGHHTIVNMNTSLLGGSPVRLCIKETQLLRKIMTTSLCLFREAPAPVLSAQL